jgi:cytochrome c
MRFKILKKTISNPLITFLTLTLVYSCVGPHRNSPVSNKTESFILPDTTRFVSETIVKGLREPMELAVDESGNIFWIERKGNVFYYSSSDKRSYLVDSIKVFFGNNDGLLGITLDPGFKDNHFLYLYYSPEGEIAKQNLSRFRFDSTNKKIEEETVMLEVPTQREQCCHSGGSLAFGPQGDLYISAGDNVSPRVQEGYSPLDERPGRKAFDAQGTAANTNDLRGKILRIHPELDGTYTIPEGNLFPKDGSRGRPEIYVMGVRNPFRISVDQKTGYLYFGDIGPDANVASERGPEAYDELNMAKKPGFYGWPYFVSDNKAYPKYDFETGTVGAVNDPKKPLNTSPNNTGARELPPATLPMISYSYSENAQFPSLGTGGRSIMAGPVYRFNSGSKSTVKFPKYYENCLFIHEWMRDWIKVIRLSEDGDFESMEDFLPHFKFASPMDMQFGADGSLYVLEYGKGWYSDNPDAKITRIKYVNGNRPPVAKVLSDKYDGRIPLQIYASATDSYDQDKDPITFEWRILNTNQLSFEPKPAFTFDKAGVYTVQLTVKDNKDAASTTQFEVVAGNTTPEIKISVEGNQSFYWPDRKIGYNVDVIDAEDGALVKGTIKGDAVKVTFGPFTGNNLSPLIKESDVVSAKENISTGKMLIDQSDCKGCHNLDKASIGPSYHEISTRYKNDREALRRLSQKVIKGGGGAWNKNFVMIAHPDLSKKAAEEMVRYILATTEKKSETRNIPPSGVLEFKSDDVSQNFQLSAFYSDRGGKEVKSLSVGKEIHWMPYKIQAENFSGYHLMGVTGRAEDGDKRFVGKCKDGGFLYLKHIDLSEVSSVTLNCLSKVAGTRVEVLIDSSEKNLIGKSEINLGESGKEWQEQRITITPTDGVHDLYIKVYNDAVKNDLIQIDWVSFNIQ